MKCFHSWKNDMSYCIFEPFIVKPDVVERQWNKVVPVMTYAILATNFGRCFLTENLQSDIFPAKASTLEAPSKNKS